MHKLLEHGKQRGLVEQLIFPKLTIYRILRSDFRLPDQPKTRPREIRNHSKQAAQFKL